MNRIIKFRGKMLDSDDWIYGFYILCPKLDIIFKNKIYCDDINKIIDVLSETVGQFTGLHDKNGKEIYEGDILRIIVNNNIEKICVVEFKNGIFGVMLSKQRELTAFPHFCNTTFEIIGNIYDNPELLGRE